MSNQVARIVELLWPWANGKETGTYQTLLKPMLSWIASANSGGQSKSQLQLSLYSRPDYVEETIQQAYKTMKFLYGSRVPLWVKLDARQTAQSHNLGLVRTDNTILVKGEKRYADEFMRRLGQMVGLDQTQTSLDRPRLVAQQPVNWVSSLNASSLPVASAGGTEGNNWLKSLGALGLFMGLVGALLWAGEREKSQLTAIQVAAAHLKKKGVSDAILVREEAVEGGSRFLFETPNENLTVIVDKQGKVYSWSRTPTGAS